MECCSVTACVCACNGERTGSDRRQRCFKTFADRLLGCAILFPFTSLGLTSPASTVNSGTNLSLTSPASTMNCGTNLGLTSPTSSVNSSTNLGLTSPASTVNSGNHILNNQLVSSYPLRSNVVGGIINHKSEGNSSNMMQSILQVSLVLGWEGLAKYWRLLGWRMVFLGMLFRQ